ncbi:FixH family protein [Flavobacterium stagni]|jgi:nitrogen fixation protein FixH|uniref:Cytochrome C oxidase Cbb3 n=1 Tax=Flavobacterium stagni TaxID=2506421 RepID=A0A4Q1KAS1_9FLAO|nr:FixH family protein [Flavobacterium stagni]RXR23490.1 cytochrome C oxidase Cbb3 [Flavobacterium stagni]
MKINWGTGIVIAFALFMSFILFFVFRVQSNSKYDNELVVEKYYLKEQTFERDLEQQNNALNLKEKVQFTQTREGVTITFPKSFDFAKINGKVSLYRPSSQQLDFEIPISLSSPHLLIPKSSLADGRWDIIINWNCDGVGYISKETIIY